MFLQTSNIQMQDRKNLYYYFENNQVTFQERNILYLNQQVIFQISFHRDLLPHLVIFQIKFSGSTTSLSKTVSRFTGLKAKFSKALLSGLILLVLYVLIKIFN